MIRNRDFERLVKLRQLPPIKDVIQLDSVPKAGEQVVIMYEIEG